MRPASRHERRRRWRGPERPGADVRRAAPTARAAPSPRRRRGRVNGPFGGGSRADEPRGHAGGRARRWPHAAVHVHVSTTSVTACRRRAAVGPTPVAAGASRSVSARDARGPTPTWRPIPSCNGRVAPTPKDCLRPHRRCTRPSGCAPRTTRPGGLHHDPSLYHPAPGCARWRACAGQHARPPHLRARRHRLAGRCNAGTGPDHRDESPRVADTHEATHHDAARNHNRARHRAGRR